MDADKVIEVKMKKLTPAEEDKDVEKDKMEETKGKINQAILKNP